MSALFCRSNAVVPFTPSATHVDKQGYLVDLAGEVATISTSATVPAKGVILDGQATTGQSSIGILGTIDGTVRMKTSGAIAKGARVIQAADGTIVTDTGPGNARVVVGVALEASTAAGAELIEVAPMAPMILP
jgi:hypothetical protein